MSDSGGTERTSIVDRLLRLWPQPVCNYLLAFCVAFCVAFTVWVGPDLVSKWLVSGTYEHETANPENQKVQHINPTPPMSLSNPTTVILLRSTLRLAVLKPADFGLG